MLLTGSVDAVDGAADDADHADPPPDSPDFVPAADNVEDFTAEEEWEWRTDGGSYEGSIVFLVAEQ